VRIFNAYRLMPRMPNEAFSDPSCRIPKESGDVWTKNWYLKICMYLHTD
jgi:hypothetical protein